jgi:hypothetical protein
MKYNILIAGVGQLGSRYLQGLFKTDFELEIWNYDISIESIERAKQRFNEMGVSKNNVHYTTILNSIPEQFDIAFITCTADVRVDVVRNISKKAVVKYWVLEKVLAQSQEDLLELNNLLINSGGVWVNTPMYLYPLYIEIRKLYNSSMPVIAKFLGFRGLACNAIHYIDFVCRWNNTDIVNYDISQLENIWVESKRPRFYDINGKLTFNLDDGSKLILVGSDSSEGFKFELKVEDETWFIYESKGLAKSSKGNFIKAPILLQSQLTADLLKALIINHNCNLPTLTQSIEQHKILLEALLEHWNQNMPNKTSILAIT